MVFAVDSRLLLSTLDLNLDILVPVLTCVCSQTGDEKTKLSLVIIEYLHQICRV